MTNQRVNTLIASLRSMSVDDCDRALIDMTWMQHVEIALALGVSLPVQFGDRPIILQSALRRRARE